MHEDVEKSRYREQKVCTARVWRMKAASDEICESALKRMRKGNENSKDGEEHKQNVRRLFSFDEENSNLMLLKKTIA